MSVPHSDLRLPSIDGLRAFDAASRTGSFERAADELHITASAVSKRISTLEDLLGIILLQRGPKSLTLTAAGREYLEQVRGALALLAAVPLHRRAVQRFERLRVVSLPTFARQILVPNLDAFTRSHPDIELEVMLSIPFLDISVGESDIEIQFADCSPQDTPLMREQVLPILSPALLARLAPLVRPSDLARATLLRAPPDPWTPWFRAAGLDWPEPSSGPRLVDLGMTLEAAVSGQGVAIGRPSLARPWLASGALVAPFDILADPDRQYRLLCHSNSEAAQAFAVWLHALCERTARAGLEQLSVRR